MKILYVEDNDDNVYMLKNRLSRAGFTIVVATNGAQGIAMASSEQPDLILMDLTLPDIDGEVECAPDGGQFQAAVLTGCWAWRSSYCAGLR
jgi:CheY-like chemotaxis protein